MSTTTYTIKSGDCLYSLGRRHRVPWQKIWEHGDNAELRERRQNPNVLLPGDEIVIPERTQKQASGATESKHTFRAPGALELSVKLMDLMHQPLADVEYHFVIDGEPGESQSTADDGIASATVSRRLETAVLVLPWGEFPVELGCVDPANTVRGIQQRLRNLGIDPGPIDGICGIRTRRALRQFQAVESEAGLECSGAPDADTIARLRELHDEHVLEGECNELEKTAEEEDEGDSEEADVATSAIDDLDADEQPDVDDWELSEDEDLWDEAFDDVLLTEEKVGEAGEIEDEDDDLLGWFQDDEEVV